MKFYENYNQIKGIHRLWIKQETKKRNKDIGRIFNSLIRRRHVKNKEKETRDRLYDQIMQQIGEIKRSTLIKRMMIAEKLYLNSR